MTWPTLAALEETEDRLLQAINAEELTPAEYDRLYGQLAAVQCLWCEHPDRPLPSLETILREVYAGDEGAVRSSMEDLA